MMMSTLMVTFDICCKIVSGCFRCQMSMVVLTFVIGRSGGVCDDRAKNDDGAGNYDSVDDSWGRHSELGINTFNALTFDNFHTYCPYMLLISRPSSEQPNFQTAHRIRPRAYMAPVEAWATRFWPIALILCNIQCIVPR